MVDAKCPSCGANDWRDEDGEFALIKLGPSGSIELHVDAPRTEALVVTAQVCGNCRFVALHDVGP